MLRSVTATQFHRQTTTGRTKPCLMVCTGESEEVELVVKCKAGCDLKEAALMHEVVAALLAADLGLPVPEPFLVELGRAFVDTIPDPGIRAVAAASLGLNFGSRKLPPGFSTYPVGKPVATDLLSAAGEILAFDTFIGNPDRRVSNPNLLMKGRELAILDHEMAFTGQRDLFWKNPWESNSIKFPLDLPAEFQHVFVAQFRGSHLDLDRFAGAFEAISDARLQEYHEAIPGSWIDAGAQPEAVLGYIRELRENLDAAIRELQRALA